MSDAPLTICDGCGGEVYRVISPSGLSFKGAGWYITDYARKGKDGNDSGAKGDVKKEPTAPATAPATASCEKTSEKTVEKKETIQTPSPEKNSEKKNTPKEQ